MIHDTDINDSMGAIEYIRNIFPKRDRFPPIIFKHQLYTLLENRTDVDRQVNSLHEKGRIKVFQLDHHHDEVMIILMSDFIDYVHRYHKIPDRKGGNSKQKKNSNDQEVVSRFLVEIVSTVSQLSVTQDTLINEHGFKDEDITKLVKGGLLTVRDVGSWWFSVPGAGQFMKMFQKGRQTTLRMIRSTKYKEILLSEIKSRKSPPTMKLGLLYHIHDLVGSDLINCISSTSGMILRIID